MTYEQELKHILESTEATPYDLSIDSAIMYIESQSNFLNAIDTNIMLEYNLDPFGIKALRNDISNGFGTKNFFIAIHKFLSALSKFILRVIEILFGISKKFVALAKDVKLSNQEFLKKYRKMCLSLSGRDCLVRLEGYKMNIDNIVSIAQSANDNVIATYELLRNFTDAEQNKNFQEYDAYGTWIKNNRAVIINNIDYNNKYVANVDDTDFAIALEYAMRGDFEERLFDVYDAINVIEKYDSVYNFINKFNDRVSDTLKKELAEIDRIKKRFTSESPDDKALARQCVITHNYVKYATNDVICTISVMIQYLGTINNQAKQICINALHKVS